MDSLRIKIALNCAQSLKILNIEFREITEDRKEIENLVCRKKRRLSVATHPDRHENGHNLMENVIQLLKLKL